MKTKLITALFLLFTIKLFAQESAVFDQNNVFQHKISGDGHYIAALIERTGKKEILLERLPDENERTDIYGEFYDYDFTGDSKHFLYSEPTTRLLHLLTLATRRDTVLGVAKNWKRSATPENQWIAFLTNDNHRVLTVYNINTKRKTTLENVDDYAFDKSGKSLIIKTSAGGQNSYKTNFVLFNTIDGTSHSIWSSEGQSASVDKILNYAFSDSGSSFAFLVNDAKGSTLWLYAFGKEKAEPIMSDDKLPADFEMDTRNQDNFEFAHNETQILFRIRERDIKTIKSDLPDMELWNYMDPVLMSYQKKFQIQRNYLAAVETKGEHQFNRLENEQELASIKSGNIDYKHDYLIVNKWEGKIQLLDEEGIANVPLAYATAEWSWSTANKVSIVLRPVNKGADIVIKNNMHRAFSGAPVEKISPDGNYLLYLDEEAKAYYSYDIHQRKKWNVSKSIPVLLPICLSSYTKNSRMTGDGFKTWLPGTHYGLFNDIYGDLWKVDLSGVQQPVNVTLGYCRKHPGIEIDHSDRHTNFFSINEKKKFALAHLFDNQSGKEGMVKFNLDGKSYIKPLFMGHSKIALEEYGDSNELLIEKENPKTPPTFFASDDAEHLRQLRSVDSLCTFPKTNSTKSLLTWNMNNGLNGFGILYKPRTFDPTKKYPVVITYYEEARTVFNTYDVNGPSLLINNAGMMFNCDSVISKGYLYFIIHIRYSNSKTTGLQDAFNYVTAGAKYLSRLPYVNAKAMGIGGHSFGGFETNYIVAHTNLFAAAVSSAGMTDFMSFFGVDDNDSQGFPRNDSGGQARLGDHSLDNSQRRLIQSSAVYHAAHINSPILLIANRQDYRVPFSQGIEFFKVLRRFGKRAWLSMDEQGHHGFSSTQMAMGFQLFDHYLKGLPAPVWMTRGIPATEKGKTLGMEYDTAIKTPPVGGLLISDKRKRTP